MSTTAKQATISIPMLFDFPVDRIIDLMVGAFEQACGYWAKNGLHTLPIGFDMEAWREENGFTKRWSHGNKSYEISDFYLAPFVGGAIVLEEIVDERSGKTKAHRFDLEAIKRGLSLMAHGGPEGKHWECGPRHFTDWVNEEDDATTADIFLQCCVLGDIVYG